MPVASSPTILYLAINLESSPERRESVLRQSKKWDIDIELVKAVSGSDINAAALPSYNRKRRMKEFLHDLSPNEHACIMSHCKALSRFLESEADFCVVFEDDVLIRPLFKEGVSYLLRKTSGWDCIKLYNEQTKIYPVTAKSPDVPVQFILPKNLPWTAVANLYTREGARHALKGFSQYWLPFDAQLGEIFLNSGRTMCGVAPSLAETQDPNNEKSDIDRGGSRYKKTHHKKRNIVQYVTHRFSVWNTSARKNIMRARLKRKLRFHH